MAVAKKKVVNPLKNKEYRLLDDRSGESFLLKVGIRGDLLVFDEKEKINRPIRHCPNERSIFLEEQSKHALVEPIIFRKGFLEVTSQNQHTQQFLDAHPDNKANGGTWFEEVNYEEMAKRDIEIDELQVDLKQAVRDKSKEDGGVYEIEAVVAVLLGSVVKASSMTLEEMKRLIYQEIDENPYYFCDDNLNVTLFNNDITNLKFVALKAISDGIIKKSVNNRSMVWVKDGKLIVSAPTGVELVDYFAEYLMSDEGMLVLAEIKKRS